MATLATTRVDEDEGTEFFEIGDFMAGLISNVDPQDIPIGACADCENVVFKPGRMYARKGRSTKNASLAAIADGIAWFYDDNRTKNLVVWANGNLYSLNTSTFAATLVASSVYTAGLPVCHTVMFRVLYFSDGATIYTSGGHQSGIRSYDPVLAPGTAPLVITSGSAGAIETPACKVMIARTGQLLLGRIKYVGGTYAKDSVLWSNVADPTTIVGTNIMRVGDGQGGEVNSLAYMAISADGVDPSDGVFCGLSEKGVYVLRGALTTSTLSAVQLNCTAGVLDGNTVKYIPSKTKARIIFLGSDHRVYSTDGIGCDEISSNIYREIDAYITDRFQSIASPKFGAARNDDDKHYVLDLGGGRHYCYDWLNENWTKFDRWTSGYWTDDAKDTDGNPVLFVTSHTATSIVQQNVGTDDDGYAIAPYWTSGWIRPSKEKNHSFKRVFCSYKTDTGDVVVTARVKQGTGAYATATFSPPSTSSSGSALWDAATWDSSVWAGTVVATIIPYAQKRRLFVSHTNGMRSKLQGRDIQITISQNKDGWFEPLSVGITYLTGGRRHAAA